MTASLFHILTITRHDMISRLADLDLTSHNLANVNTPGFKSSRLNFQEMLSNTIQEGVRLASTQPTLTQGALQTTGNALDLAVQGQGYFAVELPDGSIAYTRDGQFGLDDQNRLVNADGYGVVWDGEFPEGVEQVEVQGDGTVQAYVDGEWTTAGSIQLNTFGNPSGLAALGENLWQETPSSGPAQAATPGSENVGSIVSGAVERSNVNFANEMAHLVTLERIFQISTQTFQTTDEMIALAIQMRKG